MLHFLSTKRYQLRIDEPCLENWEDMLSAEKGKFCESCSKHVIDFTNLSDREVLNIIKNSSGSICGRLREDQQNQEFIEEKQTSSFLSAFSKIAASVLLIGASETTSAQVKQQQITPAVNVQSNKKNIPNNTTTKKTITTHSGTRVIYGRILNGTTMEPFSIATAFLKEARISATADSMGYFEIKFSGQYGHDLTLVIESDGVHKLEFTIHQKDIGLKREFLLYAQETNPVVVTTFKDGVVKGKLVGIRDDQTNSNQSDNTLKLAQTSIQKQQKKKWWQLFKK